MENKKEPLMSAEEFHKSETEQGYIFLDMFDFARQYSDYAVEWQQQQNKNLYSEDEVLRLVDNLFHKYSSDFRVSAKIDAKEWFEQFKKK